MGGLQVSVPPPPRPARTANPAVWCLFFVQVHKGYHKQLRKFVAVKRVNVTNKVGTHATCGGMTGVTQPGQHTPMQVQQSKHSALAISTSSMVA